MGRAGRIAVVGFVISIPLAIVFAACGGSDTDGVGNGSSSGSCPPCEGPPSPGCVGKGPCGCGPYDCPADVNTGSSDSGIDTGSTRINPQEAGTYMGFCLNLSDGGFACNDGLTCRLYGRVVTEGGTTKGCQERICTQPCDAGCPDPATGCGTSSYCDPVKCVP